jgi:hypothetical protein
MTAGLSRPFRPHRFVGFFPRASPSAQPWAGLCRPFRPVSQLNLEIESVWRRELGELLIYLTSHTQMESKTTKNSSFRKMFGVASSNRSDYGCSGCTEFARICEPLMSIGYETFIRHGNRLRQADLAAAFKKGTLTLAWASIVETLRLGIS